MKTDKERFKLIEKADKEIKKVCKKYGVLLTVCDGSILLHHGEVHESGDYSVREVSIDTDSTL